MNFSAILGIIAALVVFVGSILTSTNNSNIFINAHAFIIVVGGTFAASLISFPIELLWDAQKIFFRKIIGRYGTNSVELITVIENLAEGYANDENHLIQNIERIKYPFLKEALNLMVEETLSADEMDQLLRKRAEIIYLEYEEEAHVFKTMAKFPPAFGLLGAVMGMVSLMQGLGSPDSFKQIGPSMALSLVATLYGIAFANFILIPLSENLSKLNKYDTLNRSIVLDGIKLLRQKKHRLIVKESLYSYLKPAIRNAEIKNSEKGRAA